MELVEVAFECEFLLRPDPTQTFDELSAPSVALGVLEPPLSDAGEFCFEPARDDVDGNAPVGVVIDAGDLLRCYGGVPWSWEKGGDYVQFLCCVQQSL